MIKYTMFSDEEMKSLNNNLKVIEDELIKLQLQDEGLSHDERSGVRLAIVKLESVKNILSGKA